MDEDIFNELCLLSEGKYRKENPGVKDEVLFPEDWKVIDQTIKLEILSEAIHKKCLIKDTNKYKEYKK